MKTIRRLLAACLGLGLAAAFGGDALADRRPWPGGDIRHFGHRDLPHWQTGRWHHGHHDGHLGWWWIVGGLWYFYPRPVHPYPDPYVPPVVVAPPVVQPLSPPTATWYYCEASESYYPYVASCDAGWKPVPATPPQ